MEVKVLECMRKWWFLIKHINSKFREADFNSDIWKWEVKFTTQVLRGIIKQVKTIVIGREW